MHTLSLGTLPPSQITALVGGGGKTSLMFALARAWASQGWAVLCTTTTRMYPPHAEQHEDLLLLPKSAEIAEIELALRPLLRVGRVVTLAHPPPDGEPASPVLPKLRGLSVTVLDLLAARFPHILMLVEADGAAGRPLKAPADHEPVIPSCTTQVIAVMGLDALGKPLHSQWVHRPEQIARLTGLAMGAPNTAAIFAALAVHPQGAFKNAPATALQCVFCNKAESPQAMKCAKLSATLAFQAGFQGTWLAGSVHENWYAPCTAYSP